MDINYFGNNIKFFFNEDNDSCAVNKSIRKGRIWEKTLINIYKQYVNYNSVVLDIGANLGTHTIPLSLMCNNVYSFEPQQKLFSLLKKTVEYNKLDNVKLFNNIVSNKSEELDFNNTGCGRGGLSKYRPRLSGNITKENAITIDSLNLVKCDFVKIDVEGAEWDVLNGAHETINKYKPIIILETWKTKKNILKLNTLCNRYNYSYNYISSDNYLLQYRNNN